MSDTTRGVWPINAFVLDQTQRRPLEPVSRNELAGPWLRQDGAMAAL